MICQHCGSKIKKGKHKCIRICPYCKSILDNRWFESLNLCQNSSIMQMCIPDVVLVEQRGKKTKKYANRINWKDVLFAACIIPVLVIQLVFMFVFIQALFVSDDTKALIALIVMNAGCMGFWIWAWWYAYIGGNLQYLHDGLHTTIVHCFPFAKNNHIIALYSNANSLQWITVGLNCNDACITKKVVNKTTRNKCDIAFYQFLDDACGGVYVLYTADNHVVVELPAIYTEEQIIAMLPHAKVLMD